MSTGHGKWGNGKFKCYYYQGIYMIRRGGKLAVLQRVYSGVFDGRSNITVHCEWVSKYYTKNEGSGHLGFLKRSSDIGEFSFLILTGMTVLDAFNLSRTDGLNRKS